jgi:hypothetical protein
MANKDDAAVERLVNAWAESKAEVRLDEGAGVRIRAALGGALKPVRVLPSRRALAATFLAVSVAWSALVTAALDKAGFRLMSGSQMAWMMGIFAAGAVLFSFAVAACMVPGSAQRLLIRAKLVLCAGGVILGIAVLFPWRLPSAFVSEGWPCALMEAMIAIPAALVLWLLARRGALFASAPTGAAIAGLAVLLALAPLQFQCMFQQAPHLLVWHVGTAATLVGLGAWVGRGWSA